MRFKKEEIVCKTCQKMFMPKSGRNIFCNRKCFKKDFAKRVPEGCKKFPIFLCPNCNERIELDFDPTVKSNQWLDFRCPLCNILMINVWEDIKTEDISL